MKVRKRQHTAKRKANPPNKSGVKCGARKPKCNASKDECGRLPTPKSKEHANNKMTTLILNPDT